MAYYAAARNRNTDRVDFTVYRLVNGSDDPTPRPVTLTLHIGPGDTAEPVITIMAPLDT